MKILHMGWVYALLILPVFYALIRWDEGGRAKKFAQFIAPGLWSRLAPEYRPGARTRKAELLLISLAFAFLALARPQWGTHEEIAHATGLDIVIALDVSNSMEAEDIVPTRLKKAKHAIRTLLDKLSGDRIGVVAFAGSAYLASPLTSDGEYVWEVIQNLTPHSVQNQGTDIGLAIDASRKALERGAEDDAEPTHAAAKALTSKVILLVSDGEDHEDQADKAAAQLKDTGIKLYAWGVGTQKGAPVPLRDDNGNTLTFKKDRHGNTVITSFKPDVLLELASKGGGRYWTLTTTEDEVGEFLKDLGALDRSEYAEHRYLVYEDRFQYPLALAVLFLLLEISFPVRKIAALLLIALLPFSAVRAATPSNAADEAKKLSPQELETYLDNERGLKAFKGEDMDEATRDFGEAQARDPNRPELYFNQGVVGLKQSKPDAAIQSFESAAKAAKDLNLPDLEAAAQFNLGESFTAKGDFKGAAKAYLAALDAANRAQDSGTAQSARKNLQLLSQEKKKQEQKKQEDQKQDQQQKQEQQKQDEKQKEDQQKQDQKQQQQKKSDQYEDPAKSRKQFKSQKLSPEDADRVMAELNNRERELRAKEQKNHAQSQPNDKDW